MSVLRAESAMTTPEYQIFFTSESLFNEVHIQAMGFTRNTNGYVYARTTEEAQSLMTLHRQHQGCRVRKVVARPALEQDIRRYTFVEQIVNLPAEIAKAEYLRRDYPTNWHTLPPSYALPSTAA